MTARPIVVMGVSGSGKTTIGALVARRVDARFVDADELHPSQNVAKMAAGHALDDDDRAPWLRRVRDELATTGPTLVTCSALKRSYRDVLRGAGDVRFVFLDVAPEVAARRAGSRRGHFMKADMVASQFAALERPDPGEDDVVIVDAGRTIDEVVEAVIDAVSGCSTAR